MARPSYAGQPGTDASTGGNRRQVFSAQRLRLPPASRPRRPRLPRPVSLLPAGRPYPFELTGLSGSGGPTPKSPSRGPRTARPSRFSTCVSIMLKNALSKVK